MLSVSKTHLKVEMQICFHFTFDPHFTALKSLINVFFHYFMPVFQLQEMSFSLLQIFKVYKYFYLYNE